MQFLRQLSPSKFLPTVCIICRRSCLSNSNLCLDCKQDLPWAKNCCVRCAMPLPEGMNIESTPVRCGACTEKQFEVDACRTLFYYINPINTLISQFKFGARLDVGRCFGHLLGQAIKPRAVAKNAILLAPIPMHFRRFIQRGFNQSWELTRYASAISGLPANQKLVRKTRYSPAQSQLDSKAKRRLNVRNSFKANKSDVWNDVSQVIIIDDVVTTMSTVSALARCLKTQGIQRVEVYCVARAGF